MGALGGIDDVIDNLGLAGVEIVTTDHAEKNLAQHAEAASREASVSRLDKARDHFELRAEIGTKSGAAWRNDGRRKSGNAPEICRGGVGDGVIEGRAGVNGVFGEVGISLGLQVIGVVEAEDVGQGLEAGAANV